MKRLGITRAASELLELTSQASQCGVRIVPLPLFCYVSVDCPLDAKELTGIDWLCFTSARGVEFFFQTLKEQRRAVSPQTQFAVVGARTAEALTAQGHSPDFQPKSIASAGLFRELRERLGDDETVVYVGAEAVRFDPVNLFEAASVNYRRFVVYRAELKKVDVAIVESFSDEDTILFTSPKSAQRYCELFGAPAMQVLAIGEITASAIESLGWAKPEILPEPDVQLALDYCLRSREKAT